MSPCVSARAHRPVGVLADRRAKRDVGDAAATKLSVREQLLRRVERAGRQQVDLAGERRVREEVRRHVRRAVRRVRGAGCDPRIRLTHPARRTRRRPSPDPRPSFRMLRRACRSRHVDLAVLRLVAASRLTRRQAVRRSRDTGSTGWSAPPTEAGTIGGVDAAAAGTWRRAIDRGRARARPAPRRSARATR